MRTAHIDRRPRTRKIFNVPREDVMASARVIADLP